MTDKQKIRAEIESSMKACEEAFNICPSTAFGSRIDSYKALLSFIDSLPEEPASEGLQEEFERFLDEIEGVPRMWHSEEQMIWGMDIARHFAEWQRQKDQEIDKLTESPDLDEASWKYSDRDGITYGQRYAMQIDFKAGAEWQKEQLMKHALDCSIIMHPNDRFANYSVSAYVPPLHPASTYISNGDKVKIIIIREEEI